MKNHRCLSRRQHISHLTSSTYHAEHVLHPSSLFKPSKPSRGRLSTQTLAQNMIKQRLVRNAHCVNVFNPQKHKLRIRIVGRILCACAFRLISISTHFWPSINKKNRSRPTSTFNKILILQTRSTKQTSKRLRASQQCSTIWAIPKKKIT